MPAESPTVTVAPRLARERAEYAVYQQRAKERRMASRVGVR